MKKTTYKIKEKVWLWGYDEVSPWHFVSVPKKESVKIKKDFGKVARGWRSVPVEVTIGKTTWKTSIFLDSRTDTYLLPLKASVRRKEGVYEKEYLNLRFKILL